MKKFIVTFLGLCFFVTGINTAVFAKRFERKTAMGTKQKLVCTVKAEPKKDSCRLTLLVANQGSGEAVLKSATSQKYDFLIADKNGKKIWQWSQGQQFSQLVVDVTVAPKDEMAFSEQWHYNDNSGNKIAADQYKVQGIVTIQPKPLESGWVFFTVAKEMISDKPEPIEGKVTKIKDHWYLLADTGKAYLLPNPPPLLTALEGKRITVTSYKLKPVAGTEDIELSIGAFVN